jgi:hypothetical protein
LDPLGGRVFETTALYPLHGPPVMLYSSCRGGQTFLFAGQISKNIRTGLHISPNLMTLVSAEHNFFFFFFFFFHLQHISSFSVLILNINLVYAMIFKMKNGPRAAKISWRAALWPCLLFRIVFRSKANCNSITSF